MLGSLCCGLELDPRGRRCPVKFWRRGDFWRRKAKVGAGAGCCVRMWGRLSVGDDGLEDGSHRQNMSIFDRNKSWAHGNGKYLKLLFFNFIPEASASLVQVRSWNLASALLGLRQTECPANLMNVNPKMIPGPNKSDRPRLGPLCRAGFLCTLPGQTKGGCLPSSLASDIIVPALNPSAAVKIQRGTVAEFS